MSINAKELQRWRRERRLSQAALARMLKVHPMTVSKWERAMHAVPESVALLLQYMKPRVRRS